MKRETKILLTIIIILNIFTFTALFFTVKQGFFEYRTDIPPISNNWEYSCLNSDISGSTALPDSIRGISVDDTLVLTNTLPMCGIDSVELIVKTELQNIKVYIDNKLIFQNSRNKHQLFGKVPESSWFFIPLPYDYCEKEIRIEYTSPYKGFTGKLDNIILCEKGFGRLYVLFYNLPRLVIAFVILVAGLILLSIYWSLKHTKTTHGNVLYLALMDIASFNWSLLDCKVLEVFCTNYFPYGELKIITLYIIAIIFNTFLKMSFYKEYNKIFNRLIWSYASLLVVNTVLHMFNILHYVETIIAFHVLIAINFGCLLFIIIKNIKSIKLNTNMLILFALPFIIPVSLITYGYYTQNINTAFPIMELSILIFSLTFTTILGKLFLRYYNLQIKNEVYKKMAYTDSLTNIANRAAYFEYVNKITDVSELDYTPYLFIFDLNNLKKVNDTLGHSYGDEYIIMCSKILLSTFGKYGTLYRIGGDEFAFINNQEIPIDECISTVQKRNLEITARFSNINVGIAFGYSPIDNLEEGLESSYILADKDMYKNKNKMKHNEGIM